MNKKEIEIWDIVRMGSTIVQVVGFKSDQGVHIQDIHTKTELTHVGLLKPSSKDEMKWFCENAEHINFTPPNGAITVNP